MSDLRSNPSTSGRWLVRLLALGAFGAGLGSAAPDSPPRPLPTSSSPSTWTDDDTERQGVRVLTPGAGSGALSRGYRLAVVDVVPELPPELQAPPAPSRSSEGSPGSPRPTCPVEVRGIAWGDEGGLAVLAAGDRRAAVRAGDRLRLGALSLSITAVGRDHVKIRYGNAQVRCDLGG